MNDISFQKKIKEINKMISYEEVQDFVASADIQKLKAESNKIEKKAMPVLSGFCYKLNKKLLDDVGLDQIKEFSVHLQIWAEKLLNIETVLIRQMGFTKNDAHLLLEHYINVVLMDVILNKNQKEGKSWLSNPINAMKHLLQ